MVAQCSSKSAVVAQCSSSKSAVVDNNAATTPSLPQTVQAISYHSSVDTESHLLADESSIVLGSCDRQHCEQAYCMSHNKPKQALLLFIKRHKHV